MDTALERKDRKLAFMAFIVLLVIVYTSLSADCATGGSCTFASGTWFDWIATTFSG